MPPNIPLKSINVVIIDDNQQVRFLIKEILQTAPDIKICDEAESLKQAKDIIAKWKPDVTIFDILLEEYQDSAFLKELAKLSKTTKVIVLSAHSEANYSDRCIQAGAQGYVCKDKAVRCLVPAIREVNLGNQFVSS